MKKKISGPIAITILTSLLLTQTLYAWTYYNQGQHPFEIKQRANIYIANNPFLSQNQYHDRTQRNPYSPHSIYNDPHYEAHLHSYFNKFQGTIGLQLNNSSSISNPYGKFGSQYDNNRADYPYRSNNWRNPYSQFQTPYDPNSARHNPKYGIHLFDSRGGYLGHDKYNTYHNGSRFDPYSHNPFTPNHTTNPYGKNKRM